jgi:hypothetical protein
MAFDEDQSEQIENPQGTERDLFKSIVLRTRNKEVGSIMID